MDGIEGMEGAAPSLYSSVSGDCRRHIMVHTPPCRSSEPYLRKTSPAVCCGLMPTPSARVGALAT